MAMNDDMIALIDQRIRATTTKDRANGLIVIRSRSTNDAAAVFAGSSTPVQVKVPSGVHAFEGDLVCLDRYGSLWVVTHSFGTRGFGKAFYWDFQDSGAASTSGWQDMPGSPSFDFAKRYDATVTRLAMKIDAYASNAAFTAMQHGILVAGQPNTATALTFTPLDIGLNHMIFNQTGINIMSFGVIKEATMPAGDYVLTARWRVASGTGNINTDSNDVTIMEAAEILPDP